MRKEAGAFAVAFLIAEFLYKFKSFALECLAFLATWYVLSFIQSLVIRKSPTRTGLAFHPQCGQGGGAFCRARALLIFQRPRNAHPFDNLDQAQCGRSGSRRGMGRQAEPRDGVPSATARPEIA